VVSIDGIIATPAVQSNHIELKRELIVLRACRTCQNSLADQSSLLQNMPDAYSSVQSLRSGLTRWRARLSAVALPARSFSAKRWFGGFRGAVLREADLFIRTHGALAHRYARDHVRLGQRRNRVRDERLYAAVAEEIARRSTSSRKSACVAGAMILPDWLPALNGAFAILI
jgi:hypothetical protein